MNAFHMIRSCTATAVVGLGAAIGFNPHLAAQQPRQQQPPSPAGQERVEVLTRGPLHEAFAETITYDPEPGFVAPKAPPDPIEEVTPDQRPEGANMTWIPGYWGWDDERNDFLWVSGIWRALPPGRQWVPGYWGQSQQGSQWTSGYWADASVSEIDYLPEPPATVESGPNVAAPSADHIWLPGCWIWQQNRYAWRAGYWTKGHQDWDWVPDHYVWTPGGYVFVDGYYDYSAPRRGIVFAPVYFHGGLRTQRGYSYTPSVAINTSIFSRHLFLRPGSGHYYFGDYYDSNYADAGFTPWFSFHSGRRGYDPFFANQRWQHRQDRGWEQRVEADFHNFRNDVDSRPPHNWAAQRELAGRGESIDRRSSRSIAVATPYEELTQRRAGPLRFQSVEPTERQQFGQRGQEYRRYLQQRQQLEANAARTPGADPAAAGPARRELSRSPFVAPPVEQLGRAFQPPQRRQVLKPDMQVQPQPRTREQAQPQRAQPQRAQPQSQQENQGNRRGASGDQPQGRRGQGANRGSNRQGASGDQQEGPSQNQSGGDSQNKKKD